MCEIRIEKLYVKGSIIMITSKPGSNSGWQAVIKTQSAQKFMDHHIPSGGGAC